MTAPRPHPNRAHWDARYRDYQPRPPSALLQRWLDRLTPSLDHDRALDVACGTGRNALALAEHGWRVLGVDISPVALHIARDEARQRGVDLDLVALDLDDWPLPPAHFDLICVFRFLDRALCSRLPAALKPGGFLIYETFTVDQRRYEGGPRDDAFLLQPGELPTLFPDLAVLEYNEGIVEEDGRPRALGQYVGRLEG
jgi:SAM-dependent methyltransferase